MLYGMNRVALQFRHYFTSRAGASRRLYNAPNRIQRCFVCNAPFHTATRTNPHILSQNKRERLWTQSRYIITEPLEEESEETTENQKQSHSPPLKVSATYMARSVDVVKLQQLIFQNWPNDKFECKADRDWIILSVAPEDYYRDLVGQAERDPQTHVYMSVSRRGSIVYVNATYKSLSFNIESLVSEATTTHVPPGAQRATEDMQVDVDESMEEWSGFSNGRLKLRKLDLDNIRIINSCMAQTVNLAFYEGQVDKMYEIVGALNQQLEEQSVRISSRELYKHLGENNTISNNVMLSGLRNTVRPGSTAWKEERYSELQGLLWEEFDLEDRYDELQRKLSYINDSIKYSLDMLRDNKSIFLERMIVFLISAELGISCINADIPERLWHWLLHLGGP